MGQGANMPTIGSINQGAIQYVNNPLQSPQLQSTSLQGSPSQHSPMGTQAQVGSKVGQSGAGDQTTQVQLKHGTQHIYVFHRNTSPDVSSIP